MADYNVSKAIHASRHATGGADEITPEDIGAIPATRWLTGTGSPEGVVSAPVGTVYTNTTTGEEWHKRTGTGTTGWRGPLVLADHPMLVKAETTIASWNASGTVTGALPSGWAPAAGLAGYVKVARTGTAVVLRLRAVTTSSTGLAIPTGYQPTTGTRVTFQTQTGAPTAVTFSGAGTQVFIPAATYSDEPREFTSTPWLVPATPLPA